MATSLTTNASLIGRASGPSAFRARGFAAGDRLAAYLDNRVAFIDLFLACARTGIVLVPINILYREREISHIVADASPRLVVTERAAFQSFPGLDVLAVDELTRDASRLPATDVRRQIDGDSPAALVYTSGTTGRSKGAILSHNNFLANTANLVASWRITSADRYLAVLPLFHVHGLVASTLATLASLPMFNTPPPPRAGRRTRRVQLCVLDYPVICEEGAGRLWGEVRTGAYGASLPPSSFG